MTSLTPPPQLDLRWGYTQTELEVATRFFDYPPRRLAASNRCSGERPEFVLGYRGTPLHIAELEASLRCLADTDVLGESVLGTEREAARG